MSIENEISRATQRIAAFDTEEKKTASQLDEIIARVKADYKNDNFDFSKINTLVLHQLNKKRIVKQYEDPYSTENILCQCCKQILDRSFKIKYPNRNRIIKNLFNTLPAATQMSDFTIVKADFQDYFNSISSTYVFEKYLSRNILDRQERDMLWAFTNKTQYAYAGLSTSNAIAEIIALKFDASIRKEFYNNGLIYYERYIDDFIIMLNQYVEEDEIKKRLYRILDEIFSDHRVECDKKCKTKFNKNKFRYISSRSLRKTPNTKSSFDFLGYEFWLENNSNKINIQYGITKEKRGKYNGRLDYLISLYTDQNSYDYHNMELLRHRILAFTSREVYITKKFNTTVWRVKGFIANYSELRYFLDTDLLENDTKHFLEEMVEDAFNRAGLPLPYFMKGNSKISTRYNLFGNMKTNNTILLVDRIGYDYKSLVKLCKSVDISATDVNGVRRGYGTLVRDYLIKVKVGY